MTTVTLNSLDVCPKMVDLFNDLNTKMDLDDIDTVMAIVSLARVLVEDITEESDLFWDSSVPFADAFMSAVAKKYGSEE